MLVTTSLRLALPAVIFVCTGGRPHIRAPRTVEKITRRDGRDSRHEYALTLRLEPESNDRGLIDDTRRRRSLTPGSSMDYCIYSRDACSLFFITYYSLHDFHDVHSGGTTTVPSQVPKNTIFSA